MTPDCHDLHVHTRHSKDVFDEGATFEALAALGRERDIAVGFADHLEATFFSKEGYCFGEDRIGAYLEESDEARVLYPETSLGVELEYYLGRPDLNALTLDWLDRHRGDFDRVLGSAHHVFEGHAVTWHVHMREVARTHSFAEVLEEYLAGLRGLVESGMADCLAHADVVFRGNSEIFGFGEEVRREGEAEVLDVVRGAMAKGMAIEVNLLGVAYGTDDQPSPPWGLVDGVAAEGARLFVGSDAHSREAFLRAAPAVEDACGRLRSLGAVPGP